MSKIDTQQAMKELTMILMYLSKFKDRDRGGTGEQLAWKGFNYNDLNALENDRYIEQDNHRASSVVITEEGLKFAKELLEKYQINEPKW